MVLTNTFAGDLLLAEFLFLILINNILKLIPKIISIIIEDGIKKDFNGYYKKVL